MFKKKTEEELPFDMGNILYLFKPSEVPDWKNFVKTHGNRCGCIDFSYHIYGDFIDIECGKCHYRTNLNKCY